MGKIALIRFQNRAGESNSGQPPPASVPEGEPSTSASAQPVHPREDAPLSVPKASHGIGKGKIGFGGIQAALVGQGAARKDVKKGRRVLAADGSEIKKRPKKKKENFNYFVYKVMRQIHPGASISTNAIAVMNSFVYDVFQRLATEASVLSKIHGVKTIQTRDIQTAATLLLPGELGKHAISEGAKAVQRYLASM